MSNEALNNAFERSRAKGIARLVMLAIADRADKSGRAYCGAKDIGKRANIAAKNVPSITRKLEQLGELQIELRAGPKCCNVYQILMPNPLAVRVPNGKETLPRDPLIRGTDPLIHGKNLPNGKGQTPRTQENPTESENSLTPGPDAAAAFNRLRTLSHL